MIVINFSTNLSKSNTVIRCYDHLLQIKNLHCATTQSLTDRHFDKKINILKNINCSLYGFIVYVAVKTHFFVRTGSY